MSELEPQESNVPETPAETPAAEPSPAVEAAPEAPAAEAQGAPEAEAPAAPAEEKPAPKPAPGPRPERPPRPERQDRPERKDRPERRGPGGPDRGGERGGEKGGPERGGDRGRPGDRRGPREGGGKGPGGRGPEGPVEMDLDKLMADSLYLDNLAHVVVARMRDMDSGTRSQLRRLHSAVRRACRAGEAERQHQFVMLRARLAYTIARHGLRSLDPLERLLLQVTRRNDARGYERFRDLFEAIVAYNE
jgi:CRISPR type III-A-associated protein Csm2